MEGARNTESERWYFCVELGSIVGDHLITTLHRADWGFKNSPARVLKTCAWQEVRLLAYHPLTLDLAYAVVGVSDNPMPRHKPCRNQAGIGDRDGIRKDVAVFLRHRLTGEINRPHIYFYLMFLVGGHVFSYKGCKHSLFCISL